MAKSSRPPPDETDPKKIDIHLAAVRRNYPSKQPSQQQGRRTPTKKLLDWLSSQLRLYGRVMSLANDPLIVTDHMGKITLANEAANQVFATPQGLERASIQSLMPERAVAFLDRLAGDFVSTKEPPMTELMELADASGQKRHFELQVVPVVYDHVLVRCIFVLRDVTEQHRLRLENERLLSENLRLQTVNQRTGLLNETAFRARAQEELAQAYKQKSGLLVVFVDADGLKGINDTYGHDGGNKLITELATRFRDALKEYGRNISHFHGDEFAASVPCPSESAARAILARLATALDFHFEWDMELIHSLSTIGGIWVSGEQPPPSFSDILSKTDATMYRCKKAKKDGSGKEPYCLDMV